MKYLIVLLGTVLMTSCREANKHANYKSTNSIVTKNSLHTVSKPKMFGINSIKFKYNDPTTQIFFTDSISLCPENFLKADSISYHEENILLRQKVTYLSYSGNLNNLLKDGLFYSAIYEKVSGIDSIEKKMQGFRFIGVAKREINNYGTCYIAEFKFTNVVSAGQERVFVLLNTQNKEVTIWNFSNLTFSEKHPEYFIADLKIRNYKHSFYTIRYNKNSTEFVTDCYKVVTQPGY